MGTGTGTGQAGKSYFAKREHYKANKEVFGWLLKNNKNTGFTIISRFDWLSLDFPVVVREFNFFPATNGQENCPVGKQK